MNFYEFFLALCKTFVNDKILVIMCVSVIAGLSLWLMPQNADTIITSAFTGLFGVAVGREMQRRSDKPPEIPEEPPK